jgi:hypothetical protein
VLFDSLRTLQNGLQPAIDTLAASKAAQLSAFDTWCASSGLTAPAGAAVQAFHGAAAAAVARRTPVPGGAGGAAGEDAEAEEELDPAETFEQLQMAR